MAARARASAPSPSFVLRALPSLRFGHDGRVLPPRRNWPFSYVANVSGLPLTTPIDSYEAVIAGGGLGLVAGVALARRGLRVMVFDRDRVGAAHREWNISAHELASLEHWGIFSHDEIASTIATRYRRGVISF